MGATARDLVLMAHREAKRASQRVPKTFFGVVTQVSPLRIRPVGQRVTISGEECVTPRDTILDAGDLVSLTPVSGKWLVVALEDADQASVSESGGSTDTSPTLDPTTTPDSVPSVNGRASARIIAKSRSYIGVKESSPNRSTQIDIWQQAHGLLGLAWCGMFVSAMYREANVDAEKIPQPAVANIYNNAIGRGPTRSSGASRLIARPIPGCIVVRLVSPIGSDGLAVFSDRDHVLIYISGPSKNARVISGNSGDRVNEENQPINQGAGGRHFFYIAPKGLIDEGTPDDVPADSGAANNAYTDPDPP